MDETLLHDVVAAARRAGADAAEAVGAERRALSVASREGKLEEVEREESRDLSLRVFVGQRTATVSGSDLSPAAVARLVDRAVAMAKLAPEDKYAALAPEDRLAKGPLPDLNLYDPGEPSAETLEAMAREADAAARAGAQVTNTDGGNASWSASQWRLVTSGGFSGEHRASGHSLYASAIAGEGSGMERGGDGRSVRHAADLPSPGAIGAEAARRAAEQLGARKIASTTAPVLFDRRLATSLLSPLIGAISGGAVARGVSFLKTKLGERLFASGITISDDPLRVRGLGSAPFDDEGVTTTARDLIADGVLTTWLMNTASARQLELETTGHASRSGAGAPGVSVHNLTFHAGSESPSALMVAAGEGLQVTGMFGPSLNANTGDWSVGCSGLWWEGGAVAYPVTEITVAGNLLDIYARLVPANDLEFRNASNAPSLFVDALAIAGKMSADLALLIEAARAAGALMLEMRDRLHTRAKADGSPVTDADLAVDALLKRKLMDARPGYGWLSEETTDDPARLGCERVFMVDPIDGTTAYIRGKPWFCTALAVVERGRPVAAVVFGPQTGQLFAAALGEGATLNGAPIRASAVQALDRARVCGDARALCPPDWPPLEIVKRSAIAYRMALTAAGEVDATVSPRPKWEWDVAAGALIAAEAGAAVTDANGAPLVFNGPSARLPGLVCCAPALLGEILKRTLISQGADPMPQPV